MTAAPGIVTSGTGPPNATVVVQPGMNVQPVVLVDQNGQFVTTSGSTATAGYLADLTGSVNVSAATAPTVGQVLTATGGSAATWQNPATGFANPMTTFGDLIYENASPVPARLAGGTVAVRQFLNQTGNGTISAAPAWGTITAGDLPFALPLPVIDGGTGGTTATTGFSNLSPMTTGGDIIFESGVPAPARLAGNATSTKEFLTSTGSGGTANAPAWGAIAAGDVPVLNQNTTGSAATAGLAGSASALVSATTIVNVSAAAAPSVNQVLTATSGSTATWQFGAQGVLTTGGDMLFESGVPALARLAGNTSSTKNFLTSTGAGGTANAPAWGTIATTDLPVVPITKGGSGQITAAAAFNALNPNAAPANFKPANPASGTSTTLIMAGIGTACTYTPSGSGLVAVQVTGTFYNAIAVQDDTLTGRYGGGTAPANGVAVTGTRWGAATDPSMQGAAAGAPAPFAFTDMLTLTPATAYWFDLAFATGNAADAMHLATISMTVFELPAG